MREKPPEFRPLTRDEIERLLPPVNARAEAEAQARKSQEDGFCDLCREGNGMVLLQDESGKKALKPCQNPECVAAQKMRIWKRALGSYGSAYSHYTLESLLTDQNLSLMQAKKAVAQFCLKWPYEVEGKGLIFTGSYGLGKTHLALAAMRKLIVEKNVKQAVYVNERRFFQEIRDSYSDDATVTESALLRRMFSAKVLVLDELGTQKPTEWAQNKLADIIDTRMGMAEQVTFITTNLAMQAEGENSLGERIGILCYSRISAMCVHYHIAGEDYRQGPGRATGSLLQ
ncbi:MAG: ATP-binding protein [Silvibacterium sp.]|nr:ATP-binding protein [Silvibacterium sp.]